MLEKVYCDMDPEEGVDEEYKSTNDKVFTWQLLRSIADNDLTKFMNRDYDIEQLSLEYVSLAALILLSCHLRTGWRSSITLWDQRNQKNQRLLKKYQLRKVL